MIHFYTEYRDEFISGVAVYLNTENSFYYEPWNNVDFSLLVGNSYASLDISIGTGRVCQLTGLSPRDAWIEQKLSHPKATLGCLKVSLPNECQAGMGLQYAPEWRTYFDDASGWICIGSPCCVSSDEVILFACNTIAVVSNGNLKSVWIKPVFLESNL